MKIKNYFLVIFFLIFTFSIHLKGQGIYKSSSGTVKFLSDAPLELIKAQSAKLTGIIKTSDRTFAFKVSMKSFEGFNSSLQKTHFNENYVELDKFPDASFEGKIIEDIDFSSPGKYEVRGKGKFNIHGVEQERIIKCTMSIINGQISISSKFSVLLADHNIKIPSVVSQKIAEEVKVDIQTELIPKQ